MMQRWDDLTPEEQARYMDREQLLAQLAAATAERDALRAQVERFGADQWRRGAGNKEPQEFEEWKREQA